LKKIAELPEKVIRLFYWAKEKGRKNPCNRHQWKSTEKDAIVKNRDLMGIFGCIALLIFAAVALASPVPETGQTTCYDEVGNIINPCPSISEPFYGQDANYSINPMSYTKLEKNGGVLSKDSKLWAMVRDNVTGLVWEVKTDLDGKPDYSNPHDADNVYVWYNSTNGGYAGTQGNGVTTFDTEEFINALNEDEFGGYTDWRLPTIKELDSIVNYNIPSPGPTINPAFFPSTQSYYFWCSTNYAFDKDSAWAVTFYSGVNDHVSKNDFNRFYARAVRGEQSQAAYVDNNDGTVSDTSTGLMWQQDAPVIKMRWNEALSYCESLPLGGYTDWRLPTKKELRSLLDYSLDILYKPVINYDFFPKTQTSFYWSSTSNAYATDAAWGEHFADGYDYSSYKNVYNYFRAVRGGQTGPTAICNDVIIPADSNCSATASIDNGSFDPAGSTITLSQSPSGAYPLGCTSVTLTVTNSNGASSQCTGTVTVVDATPPKIKEISADPSELWPPNGKMVNVTINYCVTDKCSKPECRISSVTSNEPISSQDYTIIDAHHVKLRADRLGKGNGRIYKITITCTDASGNSSKQAVTVTVAHDQKGKNHRN
jgi:hypothetical protein